MSWGDSCVRGSFQATELARLPTPSPPEDLGSSSCVPDPSSQFCIPFQPQTLIYAHLLLLTQNQTPEANRET